MTSSPVHDRVPVLDVRIDALDFDAILDRVRAFVSRGSFHQIITANPIMILAAEKSPPLAEAFRGAALVIPDSIGVVWAARLRGHRLARVPGIDLMQTLCREAAARSWRVYFLGASQEAVSSTVTALKERFPGLFVVGFRNGYFGETEEAEVIRAVASAAPDLLFVAMNVPRQDAWIHANGARLGAKVSMGVGGSFDVISGRLKRSPAWMQAAGLEWLYRLIQEPWRAKRMADLPVFVWRVLLGR